jgi:hypothetical protein
MEVYSCGHVGYHITRILFALHAPDFKYGKDGLMKVSWPKHVVKINIKYIVFDRNQKCVLFSFSLIKGVPIPVAARSKVWVCGRSLAEIVGSNYLIT